MKSHDPRPVILDKKTDREPIRRLKDGMRRHLDDYLDFAEAQPELVAEWKATMPGPDGKWRNDADSAKAVQFLSAARSHFKSRHPDATATEVSEAYSSYDCLVRGWFVEGSKPSWSAIGRFTLEVAKVSARQQFASSWALPLALTTFTVCAVIMSGVCLMGVVMGKAVVGNAVGSLIFACAAFIFIRVSKAVDRVRQAI